MDEPVTPELALVDPELADRARAALPAVASSGAEVGARAFASRSPVRPGAPEVEGEHRSTWRAGVWRGILPLGVLSVAAGSLWFIGVLVGEDRRPVSSSANTVGAPNRVLAPGTAPVPSRAPARNGETLGSPAPSTSRTTVPPPQVSTRRRRPAPAAPRSRSQAAAPVPAQPAKPSRDPAQPAQGRVFGWVPVRSATHYQVEFFRGSTKIFEARPAAARLELPRQWAYGRRRYRLVPGRYLWVVRPGFGLRSRARYGDPIVRARLTIAKS